MTQSRKEKNPFLSIAGILRDIYLEQVETNSLLTNIQDLIKSSFSAAVSQVQPVNIDSLSRLSINIENKKLMILNDINAGISAIGDSVREYFAEVQLNSKSSNGQSNQSRIIALADDYIKTKNNLSNQSVENFQALLTNLSLILTNIMLTLMQIKAVVSMIFDYLPYLSQGNNKSQRARQKLIVLGDFATIVERIEKAMNKQFAANWKTFIDGFVKFLGKRHSGELIAITTALGSFSYVIRLVSIHLNTTKNSFWGLALAMLTLSVFVMSPIFLMGMGVLIGALFIFRKILGDDKESALAIIVGNSNKLAFALIALAAAVYVIGKVDLQGVLKFVGVMLIFALVLSLFANGKEQGMQGDFTQKKEYKISGIFSLAVGLSILALAVNAMGEINWEATFQMVIFLLALGVAIGIGHSQSNMGTQVFMLALGLGILILSIDAIKELDWKSIFILLGFIFAFGLAIAGVMLFKSKTAAISGDGTAAKVSGNGMPGLFGFAFGIGLIVLALDAASELKWQPVIALGAFVAAIVFTLGIANKMSGGVDIGSQFNSMALGITAMIGVLKLAGDIPLDNVLHVGAGLLMIVGIMFLFKLGFKDFELEKKRAIEIGTALGILLLALKAMEFIKTDWKQIAIFGTFVITTILLFKIIDYAKDTVKSANQTILKILPSLIALVGIAYIISSKVDGKDLLEGGLAFAAVVGSFALVYSFIGKAADNIKEGASAVFDIVKNLFMFLGVFYILSKIKVNPEQLLYFGAFVTGALLIFAGAGLIANQIKKGAMASLVATVPMLIFAGVFYLISKINVNWEQLAQFGALMLGTLLIFGIAGIAPIPAAIAAGAAVSIVAALATILFAKALEVVSKSFLDFKNIGIFIASLAGVMTVFGATALFAIPAMVSLPVVILISLALPLIASKFSFASKQIINKNNLLILGVAIGAAMSVFAGLTLVAIPATIGAKATLAVSKMIPLISLGFAAASKANISLSNIFAFAKSIGTILTVLAGMSIFALPALATATTLGKIGENITTLARTLSFISRLQVNKQTITSFAESVKIIVSMLFDVGIVKSMMASIVSKMINPVFSAVETGARVVSKTSFYQSNVENIKKTIEAMSKIVLMFDAFKISNAISALIISKMLRPIFDASYVGAQTLIKFNDIKLKTEKLDMFKQGTDKIIAIYDGMGTMQAIKNAIKASAVNKVFRSSLMAAQLFKQIGDIKINDKAMESFGNMLGQFVDIVLTSVENSSDRLTKLEPALNSFAKLISSTKSLSDIVTNFANAKIGIYKFNENTKMLDLVGYEKIDESVMGRVGTAIGVLIQALLKPFTIMSSDDTDWDFGGGIKVKNPFKRDNKIAQFFLGDKKDGGNRLELLGKSYSSIAEILKAIGNIPGIANTDNSKFQQFSMTFGSTIKLLVDNVNFLAANKFDYSGFYKTFKSITDMLTIFDKVFGTAGISSVVESAGTKALDPIKGFLDKLSDTDIWNRISKNMGNLGKEIGEITKNINKIDINKATALERNLKLMSQANTVEGIRQCIEELKQLINMLQEQERRQEAYNKAQLEAQEKLADKIKETNQTMASVAQPILQPLLNKSTTVAQPAQQSRGAVTNESAIVSVLNSILTKLGGTLNVDIIDKDMDVLKNLVTTR